MKTSLWWLLVLGAVALAALADSVSAIWAREDNKLTLPLAFLLILGPLVFMTFGLVTTRVGLAITSGVVNTLLVVTSMGIGLFFFGEWSKLSSLQYLGMAFAVVGIALMLFFPKANP